MRNLYLLVICLVLAACSDGDSPSDTLADELTGPADIVISSISINGDILRNAQGNPEVPLAMTIRNRGGEAAGTFKVAVQYGNDNGKFVVAFHVPPDENFYPFIDGLASGEERVVTGKLVFHPKVSGSVDIVAWADSCSGEEFVLPYCRIDEADEENNGSTVVTANIPGTFIGPIDLNPIPLPIPIELPGDIVIKF